jgi:hypothetical protein
LGDIRNAANCEIYGIILISVNVHVFKGSAAVLNTGPVDCNERILLIHAGPQKDGGFIYSIRKPVEEKEKNGNYPDHFICLS